MAEATTELATAPQEPTPPAQELTAKASLVPTGSIAPQQLSRVTITEGNVPNERHEVEVPLEPSPPASGGKVKKPRKPKLTKAQKRELRRKKALEFRKLEIRTHLERELELSKRSARRGKEDWEELCREIKMVELRQEVTEWSRRTDRVMFEKDEKITNLLKDMDDTHEMHSRNFQQHLQVLDFSINCYNTLVESNKRLYELQAQELIEDFEEDMNARKEYETTVRLNCENIMHTTNLVVETQMRNDYNIFLEQQDDNVNTEIERRYKMRDDVTTKMKGLQKQLIDFIQSLLSASLDAKKYERIHWLMDRQRNFLVESQKLNDIEFRLTRHHGELQRDLVHNEVETQRKHNDLRLEHAYFMHVRKGIENNIWLDRHITFEKLKLISGESYGIIKEFQKLLKYGELLLSLAANCRKLQTESEKVVNWNSLCVTAEDQQLKQDQNVEEEEHFKLNVLDLKAHVDLTEDELVQQMQMMKNFWRRQSFVEAQNLLLAREKRELIAENQKYIDFIKSLNKKADPEQMKSSLTIQLVLPEAHDHPCNKSVYF